MLSRMAESQTPEEKAAFRKQVFNGHLLSESRVEYGLLALWGTRRDWHYWLAFQAAFGKQG